MKGKGVRCASCNSEARCRHRDFSLHAWNLLLAWQEVDLSMVNQPLCEVCYDDLRNILIDRSDELDSLFVLNANKQVSMLTVEGIVPVTNAESVTRQ